ncbi:hypothetical protein LOTGIDRAFT_230033 [Lottia gigantea]|uniref:Uncharacterized protein n=1 Tax=Lottia gigantea TaxID=225164 RepID=V4ALA3_LOTGI|nr:hypothetical protein LOTGIDRAFT_230033 [Lottia gigantea]ESP04979.1 hypothetical protein LOTGIDRAFT_230033 [Lottia gigantea]
METGSTTCVTYRNNTFLPSLTDNQRRFLVTPASSVISGRPDMVFGLGRDTISSTDISKPQITPSGANDVKTPVAHESPMNKTEVKDSAPDVTDNAPNALEQNPESKNAADHSPKVDKEISSTSELAALKAQIIQNGDMELQENFSKEPEHSFLKANSEDGFSEALDSVSQYKTKLDEVGSKENSFIKQSGVPKQTYLTETQDDTDEEQKWTEALQRHHELGTLPEGDVPKEDALTKHSRLSQGSAHVRLPSSTDENKFTYWDRGRQFKRVPAKLIRLASRSARNSADSEGKSTFYSPPKPTPKVVSLDEAINSRPPLRIDLDGPNPCTYSPRNKPLHENNSPSWSFGKKCYIEKSGGARTSWGKMWYQTPHVWQYKVDFNADVEWPSPAHYPQPPLLGQKQPTVHEAPSYSIGVRKNTSSSYRIGVENMPSPIDYDRQTADRLTHPRQPAFTHQFRREGTVLWGNTEPTPGPGSYSPRGTSLHRSHTISGCRRDKSHSLGPFSYL